MHGLSTVCFAAANTRGAVKIYLWLLIILIRPHLNFKLRVWWRMLGDEHDAHSPGFGIPVRILDERGGASTATRRRHFDLGLPRSQARPPSPHWPNGHDLIPARGPDSSGGIDAGSLGNRATAEAQR